jgi:transcription initiation factor TFIIIB Brf1 subunit/transcription initiation factor TFIIB
MAWSLSAEMVIGNHEGMDKLDRDGTCPQCSTLFVDAGDEFVCPSCGVVGDKEVEETRNGRTLVAADFTPQALGSYMGPMEASGRERFSVGFSRTNSTFTYLKTVSDFIGRNDGTLFECTRMVERVCERLALPNIVMAQAVSIARRMLGPRNGRRRTTIAAISAFAIIASCRKAKVGSVSTNEVIEAHRALGRSLRVSSIIQLSLDSEIRMEPRRPEECVARVLARLSVRMQKEPEDPSRPVVPHLRALQGLAVEILGLAPEDSKAGHRPCALAATAVYAAEVVLARAESRTRTVTQRDVAECGDTAEYTVREQYREIIAPAIPQLELPLSRPAPVAR